MLTKLVISTMIGGLIIIVAETLRLKKLISNESSRKSLHMAHGLVVITWAFITSYSFIVMAEAVFLLVVLLARYFKLMQPLRSVNRTSWGEVFFPLGVIGLALLMPSKVVFLVAMLHLGVADAVAALVGRRFKKGKYHVFSQRKTVAGSSAFFLTSLIIILGLLLFADQSYPVAALLIIPPITTLAENLSPYGSDNFTIPLLVAAWLRLLV